ncbi:MAG: RIP metalloprotease RseP [Sphaerochaeta sp.]|uniref:RIP metalloprotease RseP n=1 Tax=Sphaerochaeta sp. TaxID=1972642 RepID=UPI003D151A99
MNAVAAILLKYLIGLVSISLVVGIHEAGHLVAANLQGIEVEVFSFGIGPKLWSCRYKGTEYRISWLPLGGYCRLKGSDDLSQALIHNQRTFTHTEEGSLFSVHPIRRMVTYLAGPLANLIFAILVYALLASLPVATLSDSAMVATVNDYPLLFGNQTSPAYEAGIRSGDTIVQIDGISIEDWQQVQALLERTQGEADITIQRNQKMLTFTVRAEKMSEGAYRFGLTVLQPTIVGNVRPASVEAHNGLAEGDRIIKVGSVSVTNQLELLSALQSKTDRVSLTVQRADGTHVVVFRPYLDEQGQPEFGFAIQSRTRQLPGKPFSLAAGWQKTGRIIKETLATLTAIFSRSQPDIRSNVTGMARSALLIGDITTLGFEDAPESAAYALLYLMGVVSISLAIANLVPLPAFDGGQVAIALGEWITKRQIRPKTYYVLQLIGIACVVVLFIALSWVDIRHFLLIRR